MATSSNKAIDYVLDSQAVEGNKKGLLAREDGNAVMYEHGIATVMLAEVMEWWTTPAAARN